MVPFEFLIAWKYFWSKKRHPFIGMISKISILGVAIGVAALIVVLAVMSGFEKNLINRIVGTYAHTVIDAEGPFEPKDSFLENIKSQSDSIIAVSPFIQSQSLIQFNDLSRGVIVKAADYEGEKEVSNIESYLRDGHYPDSNSNEVLAGDVLARVMNLKVGSEIELLNSKNKMVRAKVAGIYHSGMYEYDAHLIYIPIKFAQNLFDLDNKVTNIAVKFTDPNEALRFQIPLQKFLGFPFYVRTWRDMNTTLFGAVKLEKTVMFIILTLIILVACCNIIGTLTLLVMDKTKDIGILKALGATSKQLTYIFTIIGCFIGVLGTSIGVGLGCLLSWFLKEYPIVEIPNDIYYFDQLPIDLRHQDLFLIIVCALLLTLISTIYPAIRGAKLNPVESLRYE